MTLVICIVSVIIKINGLNFFGKESLKGQLKYESETKYFADFSKSVDSRYVGNYSEVIVDKSECVKIK